MGLTRIVEAHLVDDIQMHEVVGCFYIDAPVPKAPKFPGRPAKVDRLNTRYLLARAHDAFRLLTLHTSDGEGLELFLLPRFRLLIERDLEPVVQKPPCEGDSLRPHRGIDEHFVSLSLLRASYLRRSPQRRTPPC